MTEEHIPLFKPRLEHLSKWLLSKGYGSDYSIQYNLDKIQHVIFGAQLGGLDFGYTFAKYKKGWYCPELQKDLYKLCDMDYKMDDWI